MSSLAAALTRQSLKREEENLHVAYPEADLEATMLRPVRRRQAHYIFARRQSLASAMSNRNAP